MKIEIDIPNGELCWATLTEGECPCLNMEFHVCQLHNTKCLNAYDKDEMFIGYRKCDECLKKGG